MSFLRPQGEPTVHALVVRQVRLTTGLVLFVYVVCHLVGLVGGLFLVEGMEATSAVTLFVWETLPGTLALYAALILHAAIGLATVARSRSRWPTRRRRIQALLGLAIPFGLLLHLVDVRIATMVFGLEDGFERLVRTYWVEQPVAGAIQVGLIVVTWAHGCLGVYDWLRFRHWWRRARVWLAVAACLLPVLAILGFANSGTEFEPATNDLAETATAHSHALTLIALGAIGCYALALGTIVVLSALRHWQAVRRPTAIVRIADGPELRAKRDWSLLEVLTEGGVVIPALCGGRARCSTCRVTVLEGGDRQPAPTVIEAATLRRFNVGANVRLACQLVPRHDLKILPPGPKLETPTGRLPFGIEETSEENVFAFCVDLRDSTKLAENALPYDVFYILSAYQDAVCNAVTRHGGHVVSVSGDGIMAVFLAGTSADGAGKAALSAAKDTVRDVAVLSDRLACHLQQPLRVGIGLQFGSGLIGLSSTEDRAHFFGEPANVAARLQEATKAFGGILVATHESARACGLEPSTSPRTISFRERGPLVSIAVFDIVQEHDGYTIQPL
ncbi:MAG: 2Fe-2S iron-sulfur cluster-binding protein [Inquilinaceae bacterium]